MQHQIHKVRTDYEGGRRRAENRLSRTRKGQKPMEVGGFVQNLRWEDFWTRVARSNKGSLRPLSNQEKILRIMLVVAILAPQVAALAVPSDRRIPSLETLHKPDSSTSGNDQQVKLGLPVKTYLECGSLDAKEPICVTSTEKNDINNKNLRLVQEGVDAVSKYYSSMGVQIPRRALLIIFEGVLNSGVAGEIRKEKTDLKIPQLHRTPEDARVFTVGKDIEKDIQSINYLGTNPPFDKIIRNVAGHEFCHLIQRWFGWSAFIEAECTYTSYKSDLQDYIVKGTSDLQRRADDLYLKTVHNGSSFIESYVGAYFFLYADAKGIPLYNLLLESRKQKSESMATLDTMLNSQYTTSLDTLAEQWIAETSFGQSSVKMPADFSIPSRLLEELPSIKINGDREITIYKDVLEQNQVIEPLSRTLFKVESLGGSYKLKHSEGSIVRVIEIDGDKYRISKPITSGDVFNFKKDKRYIVQYFVGHRATSKDNWTLKFTH